MYTRWRIAFCVGCFLAMVSAGAAEKEEGPSWPQFHGPNRDNISTETGLLKKWPEEGPPLIWKYAECGQGFACVSIADGMIFLSGDFDDDEMIFALSMEGELLWKSPNGACWDGPYPGSRATPTYDDGMLYHMSATGRLAAFEAKEGKEKWGVDLKATFGAKHGTWAFAENVIVDKDRVYCVPGGTKGLVVALKKRNGKPLWANTDLEERAGYCSPIIVKYRGTRQLITITQKSVIGVDIKRGRMLWVHPHVTPMDQNVTRPIFHKGYVFVASGHAAGGKVLRLGRGRKGVTEVWCEKDLDNCHGGVILLDGRLYGSACTAGGKEFFCADFETGKIIQADKKIEKLSLTCAEGMLYAVGQKGKVYLLATSPKGFEIVSQFRLPKENRGYSFAHPVVCGGRLYIRYHSNLYVFNIRDETKQ